MNRIKKRLSNSDFTFVEYNFPFGIKPDCSFTNHHLLI